MKRKSFLKKATNSFVGRVRRRLLGEEKGAVMMEYIVVGLLIAAACVIAVAMFGHQITGMFASLAHSVAGNPDQAALVQGGVQGATAGNFQAADNANTAKHSGTPAAANGATNGNTVW